MGDVRLCEHHIQRALYWKHRSSARMMLPNYTPRGWSECDLYVVTKSMYTIEYEIKLSVSDFKADFRKELKHRRLGVRHPEDRGLPTRFFYVVPVGLVASADVPDYAGLIHGSWIDRLGPRWTVVRNAPRLSRHKRTEKTLHAMGETAYRRFWYQRFRFEEYRRSVTQTGVYANAGA